MNDDRPNPSGYNGMVNGRDTFHFALHDLWDKGLSARWRAESTRAAYIRDFTNVLFPRISDQIPLSDFDEEYFIAVIDDIANNYLAKNGREISEERLQHFRYLIRLVVQVGAENGLCEDYLWGTSFSKVLHEDEWGNVVEEDIKPALTTTEKSLTEQQEYAIFNHLMTDYTQRGQSMGLLLMYSIGLRNEEACALDFGDIRPIPGHEGCYCAYIYKSTTCGSNSLKSGGKTKNAPRFIPCPAKLYYFLEERKRFIESNLHAESSHPYDINTLPIACNGSNYSIRCGASDLTKAGHVLMKRLNVKESIMHQAAEELEAISKEDSIYDEVIQKKDPTAYVLRRNFGTHLEAQGLLSEEITYIMGHSIEGSSLSRNQLSNEDILYRILQKMEHRPYIGLLTHNNKVTVQIQPGEILNFSDLNTLIVKGGGKYRITLRTNEPGSTIKFRIRGKSEAKNFEAVQIRSYQYSSPPRENPNVLSHYQSIYEATRTKKKRRAQIQTNQHPNLNLISIDSFLNRTSQKRGNALTGF